MIGAKLRHILKGYLQPSALVLMYHRVTVPALDVWDITVHPELFEQHLQILKTEYRVMPLPELLERARKNSLPRNSLAITFDDGYQDNFLVAKPLLEKYSLPATFFVATSNIDTENEFWWDELEEMILGSTYLPGHFKMTLAGEKLEVALGEENYLTDSLTEKLRHWKAFVQEPETQRSKLFLQLWQALRPLPDTEQQHYLAKLKDWAGGDKVNRTAYTSMSSAQLKELAHNPLFELGGHTTTHPLLSNLTKDQQYLELKGNLDMLRQITECTVETCSYPYGAYNSDSIAAAQQVGYAAAFTTQAQRIKHQANPFHLGRVQVPNLSKHAFQQFLSYPR